ncbi:MAG: right-handed parallel beta-helix repeat-containing protein [Candidatus Thermoplasmatota archaeon]|nr:right-handed parallel beta-helix repeat-containing protein [Candidatus Thermoplasmatota archaeon]
MRITALVISIIAGILVLSAIIMSVGNSGGAAVTAVKSESNSKTLTSHAPIYINGNDDFIVGQNGVVSGSGTQADPYIIENWDIDASSANGIEIRNTDVYFIIRNCTIHDGESNDNYGVYFYHVQNGKINNLTSYNNYCGIHLYYSSNNTISSNQIYNSSYGIWLYNSSNNEIHYCNIYSNTNYGIYNHNTETQYQCNAIYNWWGSVSGPGQNGANPVSQNVLYDPWLTEPLDFTPPRVVETQPANNTVDIPVDTPIVIKFSKSMNTATIPGNITIESGVQIQNYGWANENRTLTLSFTSNLSSCTWYKVTINTNLRDSDTVFDSNGIKHSVEKNLESTYVFSFRTKDVTSPEITDVQANPSLQEVHGYVNITAFVSDNVMVNNVYVNIAYSNSTPLGNFSMTGINLDANRNGTYYYTRSYSVLGTYSYYIWANDTSDNQNKSDINTFTIQDTTKPEISTVEAFPSVQTQNGYVNITCTLTDNVAVDNVKVSITAPIGFTPINITMTQILGTNNYYYNSTYPVAGLYSYYIWANDTSGNEKETSKYHFTITIAVIGFVIESREINVIGIGNGTVNVTSAALPQAPPENLQYITCIEVTITGELTYANITIKYNDSDVAGIDEAMLRVYYWTGTEWKLCNNTGVDTVSNIVWVNVTELTRFAPMAEKLVAAPPVNWLLYMGIIVIIVAAFAIAGIGIKRKKKGAKPPEKPAG